VQAAGRATIRAADLVLGASADLVEDAVRFGAADARLAPVAAPPLAPASRPAEEVRRELGATPGQPLVVAVGRLHPQKGYDVLLAAVARWDRAPWPHGVPLLVVAGDGPLHGELQQEIDAARLPVALLGRRTDVADLLAAADLCVLPSRWEARSLTAQEALRAGTPLVATRVGGLPELVGGAAELVDAGDAAGLADAVVRVLTDPARARELAEAGRRQAATWPDEAATAAALVDTYRELLDRARGR
jgi:glycosyltransferase involved in cell wall biosynthesis